ncbi:MAG: class I SAM-dependent methyltransferase [Spirochaetia bacterium]|nr:class I SAM-dependent methyltransferase [Spirochaetia bacterium]
MNVFDSIAWVYGWFYTSQVKNFTKMISLFSHYIELTKESKILDVGCGTGALCATLAKIGCEVTGIDSSVKMIEVAKKKTKKHNITYEVGDATGKIPYDNKQFDIVFASFVAHGMKKEMRLALYKELSRVATSYVVIHDYNKRRTLITDILETLEKGDYFSFIEVVDEELNSFFPTITKVNVGGNSSWYICSCKSSKKEEKG